jgi:uncharacterized protein YjbI with pentapeptide repeats
MTEKASISDFDFSKSSSELTPFDVATLLQEYGDGRRKFNQVDLKNCNLSDAHLPYIHLEESLLQKADLRNAILAGASLNHIDLSSANLTRINLIAADLIRAKLAAANLTGAFLSGANLSGANLRHSNLTDCTLAGANLSGVDFTGARLKNTNMAGATLRGANLSAVDLSNIDLSELNLEGSILPANQGGATWAALRSGQTGPISAGVPSPTEPSQGQAKVYASEAFEESYDDLIEDLAEASDWLHAINPEVHAPPPEEHDSDIAATYPPDSLFAPIAVDEDSDGASFSTVVPFPIDEEDPTDSQNATFFMAPAAAAPWGVTSGNAGETGFNPLDFSDDQAETIIEGADFPQKSTEALAPIPEKVESGEPKLQVAMPSTPSSPPTPTFNNEDEATASTVIQPQQTYDVRQHPHQEEMVKTIRAALNRRTHYSLQRKLLEVYGKRCAITGCNLVPILGTVLIDSGDGHVVDHPSNGLVLRSDIKTLYDLNLIAIHPTQLTVMLAPSLRHSSYESLEGQKIRLPKQAIYHPGQAHLKARLEQCKWLAYPSGEAPAGSGARVPFKDEKEDRLDPGGGWSKVALLGAGAILGGLLMTALWVLVPSRFSFELASAPTGEDPEAIKPDSSFVIPTVDVEPENRISLQLGPLVYPLGGVIYDNSAYLSLQQLEWAGVLESEFYSINADSGVELIQANGQRFVKAANPELSGIEVGWDAETRTVILDCCSNLEIEPITTAVDGQTLSPEGVIIEGSAYVPVAVFEQLNLAQVQVSGENFVAVDQDLYVRASGLEPLGLQVTWNAETRTLNLGEEEI